MIRFHSYDHQVRYNEKDQVQRLESAKRNAVAVATDVVEAVLPDKTYLLTKFALGEATDGEEEMRGAMAIFTPVFFLFGLLWDALDIVLAPFKVAKDATDTVLHLGAFVADSRPEGEAQPQPNDILNLYEAPSFLRLAEPKGTNGVTSR